MLPGKLNGLKHIVQELPGFSDERLPQLIFLLARRLAHNQPWRLRRPPSKNSLGSVLAQFTGTTISHGLLDGGPIHFFKPWPPPRGNRLVVDQRFMGRWHGGRLLKPGPG